MRLIGIKLHKCDPFIRKALKENTWYPFGQYQEPTEVNNWTWQSEKEKENDALCTKMYQVMAEDKKESLAITVNCIVGKNGSGKSSLLDILYRIINNFSYKLWSENALNKNPQPGHHLEFAHEVHADLFFESDGHLGCIYNDFDNVSYSYFDDDRDAQPTKIKIDKNLSKTKIEQITRHFFYAICTNYSIHSLNENDYVPPKFLISDNKNKKNKQEINGKWIKGLFHKNDGYVVPITMVPFREENGCIDISNENDLAKQRLATLALLFASQKKTFMGGYTPMRISYRFNQGAELKYDKKFEELCNDEYSYMLHNMKSNKDDLHNQIIYCWEEKILDRFERQYDSLSQNVRAALLMYLAYKTLRTCMHYRKYGEMLGISKNESDNEKAKYNIEYSYESISNVVEEIMKHDTTIHVNQKIQQTLYWLENNTYKTPINEHSNSDNDDFDIPPMNVEELYPKKDDEKNKAFKTYDEAFKAMPPSIFDWEMEFQKNKSKDVVTLSQMSSGERQLMHTISYIIYHIKNIESVTDDNYRVRYHNISLIFDEAELYYHPNYQREFVSNLIKMLSWCHINHNIIRGVNILIVTHSPFVLSDVPLSNTLYLENGKQSESKKKETFCGNIHELLGGNFFMDCSIGDVAKENVEEIIKLYNRKNDESKKAEYIANRDRYRYIAKIIADQYLHDRIKDMLSELDTHYELISKEDIDKQIRKAVKKLIELQQKKNSIINKK